MSSSHATYLDEENFVLSSHTYKVLSSTDMYVPISIKNYFNILEICDICDSSSYECSCHDDKLTCIGCDQTTDACICDLIAYYENYPDNYNCSDCNLDFLMCKCNHCNYCGQPSSKQCKCEEYHCKECHMENNLCECPCSGCGAPERYCMCYENHVRGRPHLDHCNEIYTRSEYLAAWG